MRIIHLDPTTLAAGQAAFDQYTAAVICGPDAGIHYAGMWRETGPAMIAGAIIGCIRRQIVDEGSIIAAVARVSRCRRSTVRTMLLAMEGGDPQHHLWSRRDDQFHLLADSNPASLLAA